MADDETRRSPAPSFEAQRTSSRRIRPVRGLPGGRAVVGALLVTAAAVATFAGYLGTSATPDTAYVVALESIEPGTRLDTQAEATAVLGSVTTELVEPVRGRAILADELDAVIGSTVVAPLERGDLLSRTHLIDDAGAAPAQTLSFAIPRTAAVAGALRAGERVDVLATYGSGERAYTAYVVRGVPLLRVTGSDGAALGGEVTGSQLTLTVAVTALEDVQRLGHAVNTAAPFVTRSTAEPGGTAAPGAYRPRADHDAIEPDPAVASVLPAPGASDGPARGPDSGGATGGEVAPVGGEDDA